MLEYHEPLMEVSEKIWYPRLFIAPVVTPTMAYAKAKWHVGVLLSKTFN